jgi:hypothetical protein
MDRNLKCWDNNLEEDSLEDGVLFLEKLENSLLDDDDHVKMPTPSTSMVPMSKTLGTALGASSSLLPRSSTSTSAQFHDHFHPSREAPLPPRGGLRNNRGGVRRMG